MKKTAGGAAPKPTIQVIERMFALIDVLASKEEAISLKEISEKTISNIQEIKARSGKVCHDA